MQVQNGQIKNPLYTIKSAIHHDYYNDLKAHKTYQKRTIKQNHFSLKGAKIR
jgi:hypothetical protein